MINNCEIEILIEKLDNFQKAIAENIVIPVNAKQRKKLEKQENDFTIDIEANQEVIVSRKVDVSEKRSVRNSVRKSYIEEEENTYNDKFNFFNKKEVSVKKSVRSKIPEENDYNDKFNKKEVSVKKSVRSKIPEEIFEEMMPPKKKKKLRKNRVEEDVNLNLDNY